MWWQPYSRAGVQGSQGRVRQRPCSRSRLRAGKRGSQPSITRLLRQTHGGIPLMGDASTRTTVLAADRTPWAEPLGRAAPAAPPRPRPIPHTGRCASSPLQVPSPCCSHSSRIFGDLQPVELYRRRQGTTWTTQFSRVADIAYAHVGTWLPSAVTRHPGGILDVYPPTDEHPFRSSLGRQHRGDPHVRRGRPTEHWPRPSACRRPPVPRNCC